MDPGATVRQNPSGTSSSGKGKGHGGGGGPSSGTRGRGRGNHHVDQVSGADPVSDADRDYVENALSPGYDPLHEELVDESGCIQQVAVAVGGQNAQGSHENRHPPGDFRQDLLMHSQPLLDVGSLVSLALDPATAPPAAVDELGVQSKNRAEQFVTNLLVSDCKGNFRLATCLCDNGSEVNLPSNSFLPDDCVFDSPHAVTLEGVSGHSLSGRQRG